MGIKSSKPSYADYCFVDKSSKFVFIFIPKNASMSFRNIEFFEFTFRLYEEVRNNDIVNICIFRNPFDRLVSSFLWEIKSLEPAPDIKLRYRPVEVECASFQKVQLIDKFNNYLNIISTGGSPTDREQYLYLEDRNLTLNDVQVKLIQENLYSDFENFKKEYSIPENVKLLEINQGNMVSKKILMDYIHGSKDVENKISHMYAKDFEMYEKVKNGL